MKLQARERRQAHGLGNGERLTSRDAECIRLGEGEDQDEDDEEEEMLEQRGVAERGACRA